MIIVTPLGVATLAGPSPEGSYLVSFRNKNERTQFLNQYPCSFENVPPVSIVVGKKETKKLLLKLIPRSAIITDPFTEAAILKSGEKVLSREGVTNINWKDKQREHEMLAKEATEPESTNASPPPSEINPGPTTQTADGYLMDG